MKDNDSPGMGNGIIAAEGVLIHLSSNILDRQQGCLPTDVVSQGWHIDCGSVTDPLNQGIYPSSNTNSWRMVMHMS